MKKFNNKFPILPILAVSFVFIVLGLSRPNAALAATSPILTDSESYSVLAGSTVTCTGGATIAGDVGVAPGTAITGFPGLCSVSPGSTQSNTQSAIDAQTDNLSAFGTLDQGCNNSYADGQDLTLLSPLGPGVYCSAGSFLLTGNLTLTGSGVWIFKTVSTLITSPGSSVTGGDPCDVWWRIGSSATLDTTTGFIGNILALTDVHMNSGASLNGRAMVQTGEVTLINNDISGPTCALPPPPPPTTETITVVKVVVGGTKGIPDFPLFVGATPVTSGDTNDFLAPATYSVTETSNANYTASYSGDCPGGVVDLTLGTPKICTITNTYTAPSSGGGGSSRSIVPPLIDVVKVPSPLALPVGPGQVKYTYTLRNIGTVPVTDVTMVGDSCSPIILVAGDINADAKLDVNETWTYTCSTTLSETHTNTVVATGWANGISAVDIASATVVVGLPVVPPLIHVTKVPSPLALPVGGELVNYTNRLTNPGTVALSNIRLTDDKCSPLNYISGDMDGDSELDTTEVWVYTCLTNLFATTTNTAIATGEANGLTATDFAVATVIVAPGVSTGAVILPPALPRTGFGLPQSILSWSIVAAGFLAFTLLFFIFRKKQTE